MDSEGNKHTTVDADNKITIKRLGQAQGDDIEMSKEGK